MNTGHFSNCNTTAQVKTEYRRLAFKLHPDLHATEFDRYNALMQDLNASYHDALQRRDGEVFTGTDEREHTYHYNRSTESDLIDAVARAIRAKLPDRTTVTIVGIYVWVEGLTRNDRDAHAALKGTRTADGSQPRDRFYFHSKRDAWYWKPKTYRARYNPNRSLEDLKDAFGARVVSKQDNTTSAPLATTA